jgi:hypothetical protein
VESNSSNVSSESTSTDSKKISTVIPLAVEKLNEESFIDDEEDRFSVNMLDTIPKWPIRPSVVRRSNSECAPQKELIG